jgi:hypothetical protein
MQVNSHNPSHFILKNLESGCSSQSQVRRKNPDQKSDLVLVQFSLIGTIDSYLPKRVPSQHWFCYATMFGNKHV